MRENEVHVTDLIPRFAALSPARELRTAVYSLAPFPMWPMGKKQGMPSIVAFHRELAAAGLAVTYIHIDRSTSPAPDEFEGVRLVHKTSWNFIPVGGLFAKVFSKLFSVPLWVLGAVIRVAPLIAEAKRTTERLILYGHTPPGCIAA